MKDGTINGKRHDERAGAEDVFPGSEQSFGRHEPSMDGKTVVVTGATSGIGFATAMELAFRGAFVIGVGRSDERCSEAERTIRTGCGARAVFLRTDLSSQTGIRGLAGEIHETVAKEGSGKIDVLINNAGTISGWYVLTQDGIELQFAVNHLAPFLLTHLLLPDLRKSPEARILTVSSGSHYRTKMNWDDIPLRKHYNCLAAYKQSKLANVLFTRELGRRIGPTCGMRAYAVDPGLVYTDMGMKGTSKLIGWIWSVRRSYGTPASVGAATSVHLASASPETLTDHVYWKDRLPKEPSRTALDWNEARRLWDLSERMCGIRSRDYGLGD